MSQNTKCHLGDGTLSGIPCSNGEGFEVRHLQHNGGGRICENPSCPHQVASTQRKVQVVLLGSGKEGRCIVMLDN